jgi:hypothetical protein
MSPETPRYARYSRNEVPDPFRDENVKLRAQLSAAKNMGDHMLMATAWGRVWK